jgi:DNA adenine methylase
VTVMPKRAAIRRSRQPASQQRLLFELSTERTVAPFTAGLLKWIGSKQRMAHQIVSHFPQSFGRYYEPFVGSGAVLATLRPAKASASDTFAPLIEIWKTLHDAPDTLKQWYADRHMRMMNGDKVKVYEAIKAHYNANPNGADFLFLCRSCYAGVVRFRKADGYMSTPCGPHIPIAPERFAARVDEWHARTKGVSFRRLDYREAMRKAVRGDLVYCDPPYSHSQAILYGAQSFRLEELLDEIAACKRRGVHVVLSIDGTKRSGTTVCDLPIPPDLFEREIRIDCGRSMLRRLQMSGRTLEGEVVADRLLLTY